MHRFRLDPEHPPAAEPERLAALDARTDAELTAAAAGDPDNLPLDDEILGRLAVVADLRRLRQRLGLSQHAFAARYGLAVGTLRDWEQGRTMPDQPARVLLTLIEREPEVVARALAAGSTRP